MWHPPDLERQMIYDIPRSQAPNQPAEGGSDSKKRRRTKRSELLITDSTPKAARGERPHRGGRASVRPETAVRGVMQSFREVQTFLRQLGRGGTSSQRTRLNSTGLG